MASAPLWDGVEGQNDDVEEEGKHLSVLEYGEPNSVLLWLDTFAQHGHLFKPVVKENFTLRVCQTLVVVAEVITEYERLFVLLAHAPYLSLLLLRGFAFKHGNLLALKAIFFII